MNILVTGATGFVGSRLVRRMLREELPVAAALVRGRSEDRLPSGVARVFVPPLSGNFDYGDSLRNVDAVVHLAARVHVMKETASDPLEMFRAINALGTANLARQAAASGVRRFVFLSTIGVNGSTTVGDPFREVDDPAPHNHYSVSKMEAEQLLARISEETGLEVVVLRAPLVYGPGNPGNFLSLLRIVSTSLPLPFASVNNRRSFIYVGNLVDAIIHVAIHPKAAGNSYLVSDGEDISTPDLIRKLRGAMGMPAHLVPFPPSLMWLACRIVRRSHLAERLIGSLQVDCSKIRRQLAWQQPVSLDRGLAETVEWYESVRRAG